MMQRRVALKRSANASKKMLKGGTPTILPFENVDHSMNDTIQMQIS